MDKSDKRKRIENTLLLIVFIILVVLVVMLYLRNVKIRKDKQAEQDANVTLTDISYGSEIEQIGYTNADGLLLAFVGAYNQHSGSAMIQIMDMVAGYIYVEEAEYDISKFEDKYIEILSDVEGYDDLIMMRYTLPKQESGIIESIDNTNVTLEVVDNTEIEDVSKYVSKMTANIRTYSEEEKIDQVDKLEFLLLNKGGTYYIIDYYVIDENGDKIQ